VLPGSIIQAKGSPLMDIAIDIQIVDAQALAAPEFLAHPSLA